MSTNSLMVLHPYLHNGMWVFDDESKGLDKEPFVAGVPEILEALLAQQGIPNPEQGFNLIFSASPFPGHQLAARRVREELGGNWYAIDTPLGPQEGWLCPALFKYFDQAPDALYVQVQK